MTTIEPALKINFKPSPENREQARSFGRRFGKKVKEAWEKIGTTGSGKTFWKCTVCGEIFEGALPPMTCPVCGVGAEAFVQYEEDIVNFNSTASGSFVIIGSGAAAVAAAEAIRKRNAEASIDIYTDESIMPYYRPILTAMIAEDVADDKFYIHPESFYEKNRLSVHLNAGVRSINRDQKTITLVDGSEVPYNKLLLATGANPFVPPIKGKDLGGVTTLRTNADLAELKIMLGAGKGKRACVVGGGLLGLESACELAKLGCEVTVIDTAPTILPRQTDSFGSTLLRKIVASGKIKIITNTVVQELYGNAKGTIEGVLLATGEDIKAEVVLISAGLTPNISLAKEAGLECSRAIVVGIDQRTSDNNIFAAGDCAITAGTYYGIWEPALGQGRTAGANMVGDSVEFSGRQYAATLNAFDTSLFALGNLHNSGTADSSEKIVALDELRNTYSALYFTDGKLDGALLIGDISKAAGVISGINNNLTLQECQDAKILK